MKPFNNTLTNLLLATLLPCLATQAMEVEKYEQMAGRDQNRYVYSLVKGTSALLKTQGRNEGAQRVVDIFSDQRIHDFSDNLDAAKRLNVTQPADHKYHVEHAFLRTLKQNGITGNLPIEKVFAINKDFKPEGGK